MDKFTNSRTNLAPTITKGRTRFDLSHPIRTTMNTGDFVCIGCEEVYPGETFTIKDDAFLRLETSLHQTMDNAYLEIANFFVPYRTIWTDFDKFMGYNDDPWAADEIEIPQIILEPGAHIEPMSILNHLCLPAGDYDFTGEGDGEILSISALPLRAIFEVWNQYFRDENYDTIISYDKGSDDVELDDDYTRLSFSFNNGYIYPSGYGSSYESDIEFRYLRVNRYHDIFSSALPAPQKGQATAFDFGLAPVVTTDEFIDTPGGLMTRCLADPMFFAYNGEDADPGDDIVLGLAASSGKEPNQSIQPLTGRSDGDGFGTALKFVPANLWADLSTYSFTINQLRLAIVQQAMKEREARSGTRMIEQVYSIWGVQSNSLELDRPEFLSGKRIPVNMMEVLQTSETGTTVLGSDAGHSKTFGESESVTKSFTEYGLIMSFAYIRTARSYSQGIQKKFFKKTKLDLYDPMMDNIGEVDIKQKELQALGLKSTDLNKPIGYQEAWYHLKEGQARDSGYFQAGISGSLDSWHYGDDYAPGSKPKISYSWLKETPSQVDRTIAVESNTGHQWSLMLYRNIYATRTMNRYSIPNTFGFGSK